MNKQNIISSKDFIPESQNENQTVSTTTSFSFSIIPIIALLLVVIIVLFFSLSYNGLVRADKSVDEAISQIKITYQRRLDLIPNLVETVKGFADHEKQTLATVIEARNKAQGVLEEVEGKMSPANEQIEQIVVSQAELTYALKPLFALVESYPNIKASTNFLTLQDQLEGTENRISIARQRYNSILRVYNTKVATFPNNIIASMFGFQERDEYFEAAEGAEKSVEVKF